MILTADIGNSNTVLGWFKGTKLLKVQRVETRLVSSCVLRLASCVKKIVIASVVPDATKKFKKVCKIKFPKANILVLNYKDIVGVKIALKNPSHVGIDRLVNAAYAYQQYKKNLVVIDMGTATTFDCVIDGKFVGGIIAPGLNIVRNALHEKTAMLPKVPLLPPQKVIGKNTKQAMQSGIFFGYVDLVEGLIARLKKESKRNLFVVATGGLAGVVKKNTKCIDCYDAHLTLHAINFVWSRKLVQ